MSGPFPDLPALSNLTYLNLSGNQLSGPIPHLSNLNELRTLDLSGNDLSGPIPDLSALSHLEDLDLTANELSGPIPDLSNLANLQHLTFLHNELSGPIPDLSNLTKLRTLNFRNNRLRGQIPDLSALSNLWSLDLAFNELSGSIPDLNGLSQMRFLALYGNRLSGPLPDLIALSNLEWLELSNNDLSGPVPDLGVLSNLEGLDLSGNDLSGPVPDLSALTILETLDLSDNRLCRPAGASLSHPHSDVNAHLQRLNLPTCTNAELSLVPPAPQNLTATVGSGQVTLAWDAVSDAASYDLWAWDSLDRTWAPIGGVLTATTYTHPVLADGRNYYFQVRARDAGGVRGAWSARVQAIIVPGRFPPPPPSLGLHIFYQKYLQVSGVVVVAPSEVADEKMAQARAIVAGMLSGNPALLENTHPKYIRVAIYKYDRDIGYISQLPEFRGPFPDAGGVLMSTARGWAAGVPDWDRHCGTFIHEFAHAIHSVLEDKPSGHQFNARLRALYDAAMNAGLWQNTYASWNVLEYWAETVQFWFQEYIEKPYETRGSKLEDYDPEIAKLIAETYGEAAYVPSYCKP